MSNRTRLSSRPWILTSALLAATVMVHGCKDLRSETITPAPDAVHTTGEIGDPCTPPDEGNALFPGFKVVELNMVSRFSACQSGVCLLNHFQGRVSCPLGQAAPTPCAGPADTICGAGTCVPSAPASIYCDPGGPGGGGDACASGLCDADKSTCQCTSDAHCPAGTACDAASKQCFLHVCQGPGGCQKAGATAAENEGKACCADGSETPVSAAVCGQCAADSGRSAAEAVYCSCRCGRSDGAPDDGLPLCACPDDFECREVFPFVGVGSAGISGKYCIKPGTEYADADQCGAVSGSFDAAACAGVPAP